MQGAAGRCAATRRQCWRGSADQCHGIADTAASGSSVVFLVAASTTAATAPATAAEPTATAATATVLFGLGLIDRQGAAVHLFAVHRGNGGLRLLVAAHFDEAEALGATRVPVHDDLGRLHRAVRREHLFQSAVGHA